MRVVATSCPGRGAAFFMPLAEPGPRSSKLDPGSAAHRFAKGYALRCVRGNEQARSPGQARFLTTPISVPKIAVGNFPLTMISVC